MVEVEQILAVLEVGARLGQSESANTLVVNRAVGIKTPERDKLALSEQVTQRA